jgi:uncharacterized protein (TIGR03435 family)
MISLKNGTERPGPPYGKGMYMTFGSNIFESRKPPASAMADTLARFVDRPVVDMTELKGIRLSSSAPKFEIQAGLQHCNVGTRCEWGAAAAFPAK